MSDVVAKSTLLTRRQFMHEYGFSDSSERRGRTGSESWPPHLQIGPAGRVYYRRESVEDWLRGIENAGQSQSGGAVDEGHRQKKARHQQCDGLSDRTLSVGRNRTIIGNARPQRQWPTAT